MQRGLSTTEPGSATIGAPHARPGRPLPLDADPPAGRPVLGRHRARARPGAGGASPGGVDRPSARPAERS